MSDSSLSRGSIVPPVVVSLRPNGNVTIVGTTRKLRNELCACGSGKKFKHCHGASNVTIDEFGRVKPLNDDKCVSQSDRETVRGTVGV